MRWLLILLVACGAAVPALPSRGGPAWVELQSDHFTLWTDAGAARGTELIEQMESQHQIVFGIALAGYPTEGRIFAIALRDSYEIHSYLDDMFTAVSFPEDNALNLPFIMLPADLGGRPTVVTHELTHVISAVAIKHQPVWFAEGLARFFETTKLDADKANVTVGDPLPEQLMAAHRFPLLPGPQLFACKKMSCRDGQFYATSMLLFAYLINQRQPQLAAFQELVAHGAPHPWETAFPDLPPEAIDREVLAWQHQGQHKIWKYTARLARTTMHQRTLADSEVLAVRALMTLENQGDTPATRKAIAEARAADPTNLMAVLVENQRARIVPIDLAHQMTKLHPEDWRSWMLVLETRPTGDELKIAQARLCTLVQSNPANFVGGWCPDSMLHPIAVPDEN
jgi:hypothetical protein